MQPLTFYQSRYHAWYFSSVREPVNLAYGARFESIYAPGVGNLKRWRRVKFRVGRWFNPAMKRYERVYFENPRESVEADEMPLLRGETIVETFGIEAVTIK